MDAPPGGIRRAPGEAGRDLVAHSASIPDEHTTDRGSEQYPQRKNAQSGPEAEDPDENEQHLAQEQNSKAGVVSLLFSFSRIRSHAAQKNGSK